MLHGGCVDYPWRFTSEFQHGSGSFRIEARCLALELGRWTRADAATYRINPSMPGEPSPYAYAACNPINYTDPPGLLTVASGPTFLGVLGC